MKYLYHSVLILVFLGWVASASYGQCDSAFTFTANPCDTTVQFAATTVDLNLTYSWDFGDGDTSNSPTPTHEYPQVNGGDTTQYTVTLNVTGPGCPTNGHSTTQTVAIDEFPAIKFVETSDFRYCSLGSNVAPQTITLYDSSPNTSHSHTINWGDGTPPISYSPTSNSTTPPGAFISSNVYNAGVYFINVVAENALTGCKVDTIYTLYNLANPGIGAGIAGNSQGCSPLRVVFDLNSFQNNDLSTLYNVDYGDGSTVEVYNHPLPDSLVHIYEEGSCDEEDNEFVFVITAINRCDDKTATVDGIKVFESPKLGFDVPLVTCVGTQITFTDTSYLGKNSNCQESVKYRWDFGDGTFFPPLSQPMRPSFNGTIPTFQHTYSNHGQYTARLITSSLCGDTMILPKTITVLPTPPSATFTIDDDFGCYPDTVVNTNTSTSINAAFQPYSTYTWTVTQAATSCSSTLTGPAFTAVNTGVNSSYTFNHPGQYIIELKDENQCGVGTHTGTVTIANAPQTKIASIPDFCATASIQPTLAVQDACFSTTTYQWAFPGGSTTSSNSATPPTIDYNTPDTFSVQLTTTNDCGTNSDTVSFTVHPLPSLPTATTDAICVGETLIITLSNAPSNVSYSWAGPDGFSANTPNIAIPNATEANEGTYTLTIKDNTTDCENTMTVATTVHALPVPTIAGDLEICTGDDAELSVSANNTLTAYSWSDNATTSSTTVSPTSTATYSVTVTDNNGCENSASAQVTVLPLPTIDLSTTPDVVCVGTATPLQGSGNSTYMQGAVGVWSGNGVANNAITATSAGTVSALYTFTDGKGCKDTASAELCAIEAPVADFDLNDDAICVDDGTVITATNSSNTTTACEAATYAWTVSQVSSACSDTAAWSFVNTTSDTSTSPALQFTASGIYRLTLTVTNDCGTSSKSKDITVADKPTVQLSGITDGCVSHTFTPTATVNACDGTVSAYSWTTTGASTTSATTQTIGSLTYNAAGQYTVTFSATNECGTGEVDEDFEVFALPAISISGAGAICEGEEAVLNVTTSSSLSQTQWTLPNNSTQSSASLTLSNVAASDVGTYTVDVIDANGCAADTQAAISLNPLPNVSAGSDKTICAGESVALTANGASTYVWVDGSSTQIGTSATVTVTPTATTTYTVTGTDTNGCKSSDQVTVTVIPLPTVSVAGSPTTICNQAIGVQLTGTPSGGTWSGDPRLTSAGVFTPGATPSDLGSITVTYTYTDPNTNCTNSADLALTVSNPDMITLTQPDDLCLNAAALSLTASPQGGVWSAASGVSLSPQGLFTPDQVGTFTVTYTINGGTNCAVSKDMDVTVHDLPTVTLPADFSLCLGESTQVLATTTTPSGVSISSYAWTSTPNSHTSNADTAFLIPTQNTTLDVTVTDDNGCTATDDLSLIVNDLPSVYTATDTLLCAGTTHQLQSIVSPVGGTGTWSGILTTASGGITSALPAADTVTYIYTDPNGCIDSSTVQVCIIPAPDTDFEPSDTIGCEGLSVTLTNSSNTVDGCADPTYTWAISLLYSECRRDGGVKFTSGSASSESPVVVFDSAGVYQVQLTTANACGTTTHLDTITIQSAPKVSLAAIPDACGDTMVTIIPSIDSCHAPITAYSWNVGGSTAPILEDETLTVGTHNISVTVTNVCSTVTANVELEVFELPTLSLSSNTPVCVDEPLNFTATTTTANGTSVSQYIWTTPSTTSFNTSNPAITTAQFSDAGLYELTLVDGNGCKAQDTETVVVHPLPNVTARTDTAICIGEAVELTADGAVQYTWTITDSSTVVGTGASFSVTPTATTSYTVTGEDANGCKSSDQVIVTVHELPVVAALEDTTLCNQPIGHALTSTPLGGTWSNATDIQANTGIFTPSSTGTFYPIYTYTDGNDCTNTDTVKVVVVAPPMLTLPADFDLCLNDDPDTLTFSPTGGTWSGPHITADGTFTPSQVGTFTLTYTYGAGTCEVSDDMAITVKPLPTVTAQQSASASCSGDSITLSVTGASAYTWSPATAISSTTNSIVRVAPGIPDGATSATFSYTVTGLAANGCSAADDLTVTIHAIPVVDAGADLSFCDNPNPTDIPLPQPSTVSGSVTGTGVWTGPGIVDSLNGLFRTEVAGGLGNYELVYTFTTVHGCVASDTVAVTVTPVVPAIVFAPLEVCAEDAVFDFDSTDYEPNQGAIWYGTGVTDATAGTYDPTVIGATMAIGGSSQVDVIVMEYGEGTCKVFDTTTVTIHPLPAIDAGLDFELCVDAALETVTGYSPQGGVWSGVGVVDTLLPTFDAGLAGVGTHVLRYVYTAPVTVCENRDSLTAKVNALPVVDAGSDTIVCHNPNPMDILLPAATPAGGVWTGVGIVDSLNGIFRTDAAGVDGQAGVYVLTYTYTDGKGCVNSDNIAVTVTPAAVPDAGANDTVCYDAGLLTLNGTPAGGSWIGQGIIDAALGIFDPTATTTNATTVTTTEARYTTHELVYTFGEGTCQVFDTVTVMVVDMRGFVIADPDQSFCVSESPIVLNGLPTNSGNGIWTGVGVTGSGTSYEFSPMLADSGTHQLTYTYTESIAGCAMQDVTVMTVHPLPIPAFAFDTVGCKNAPHPITNGTYGATTYDWDFGDGNTSTQFAPSPVYVDTGYFDIQLLATTAFGCVDSLTQMVYITEPPVAYFEPDTTDGCAPLPITFSNLTTGYQPTFVWNFGEGTTSTLLDPPTVTYQQGLFDTTYYVQLSASNLCGTTTHFDSILVAPAPIARFVTDVDTGCSPLHVNFNNLSYGFPETFLWEFGDGTTSTDSMPGEHIFYNNDTVDRVFQVRLIEWNDCGVDTTVKAILVKPNFLNSFFTPDVTVGCQPLTVNFANTSSGVNIVNNWNFGDGNTSNVQNPTHTFADSGRFRVVLTIDNGCGYDTSFVDIRVNGKPQVALTADPSKCDYEAFNFANNSPNTSGNVWDFGDGNTSLLNNPTHVYDTAGSYTVKLTVFAANTGCPNTDSTTVQVLQSPVPDFGISDVDGCAPLTVSFSDSSQYMDYYTWHFDDGNTSSQPNPVHTFADTGLYRVCLTGENIAGCLSDTLCQSIRVNPNPIAGFYYESDTCGIPLDVDFFSTAQGATGYIWQFGNGAASTLANPQNIRYARRDTFTITQIVDNAFGCFDTLAQELVTYEFPVANALLQPTVGCQPLDVFFENLSQHYNTTYWLLDDSIVFTSTDLIYTYVDSGYHDVPLVVSMSDVCFDTLTLDEGIFVQQSPLADFTATQPNNDPNDGIVDFENRSSSDAIFFNWDFRDGNTTTIESPQHRFAGNGRYWVELEAINAYGCRDTIEKPIDLTFFSGLIVPNALTPEVGSGVYQTFKPTGVGLVEYQLEIFTEWGELIWKSTALDANGAPAEGWDGRGPDGNYMQQGVYVWKIRARFANGYIWKGMPVDKDGYIIYDDVRQLDRRDIRRHTLTGTIHLLR